MHPNPIYRSSERDACLEFAREVGFGVLAISVAEAAPLISHVPFVVTESGDVEMHLVRSNPITRAAGGPVAARLAVQGPHGYVSPDWYGMEHQVPTWNYVAVHLTGVLEPLPDEALRGALDRLSDVFETRLQPKPVWTSDKMPEEAMARLMRMIRPYRLRVEAAEGTWKLAQNKPEAARLGAAEGLAASGIGAEVQSLAALMRDWREV
ncbi:FMN-binding negative transcriptional regulator [Pseudooceanicola sp. C21-150M6]|uniref:FMN-binding negative transcriptional regulator n=1 Tax=Pseudooceanicola sp. C21-150M6 TaxID=3434355 RepID=UPI003D7FFCE0